MIGFDNVWNIQGQRLKSYIPSYQHCQTYWCHSTSIDNQCHWLKKMKNNASIWMHIADDCSNEWSCNHIINLMNNISQLINSNVPYISLFFLSFQHWWIICLPQVCWCSIIMQNFDISMIVCYHNESYKLEMHNALRLFCWYCAAKCDNILPSQLYFLPLKVFM